MLNQIEQAKARWGGVHKRIDNWLNDRQQLIVSLYKLSSARPLAHDSEPLAIQVERFCQLMVDYCSAGHFEIYEQLMEEARAFDDGGLELARELVPRLDTLTTSCVDFNDRFDEHCDLEQLAHMAKDLSALGETLEERFELEDQLIERLHNAHQNLVNQDMTPEAAQANA
jgi:regulator of sigma D